MADKETLIVEVPAEVADALRGEVLAGRFGSESEAAVALLTEWKERRENHGYTIEELRRLIDEAEASGEPIDGETFMAELEAEIEARAAALERAGR